MKRNRSTRLSLWGLLIALVALAGWATFDLAAALDAPIVSAPPLSATGALTPVSTSAAREAPDFTLRTLDGKRFRLSEQRGKVVVLNFWATWCPPCRHEIPDFIAMQNEFGKDDVVFVGVSLDHVDRGEVAAYAREMGINYPVMIDDGKADAAYGPIATLPTTFLIDREGIVRGYAPGMVTKEMIQPAIGMLVRGEKPAGR